VVTSAQLRAPGRDALLRDYRDWLESELKLLGNASHHAYAFGQANMAKRALERFEAECADTLYVGIAKAEAYRALTALEMLNQSSTATMRELDGLREAIKAALMEAGRGPADDREPLERDVL
jgi:hypothetical protein